MQKSKKKLRKIYSKTKSNKYVVHDSSVAAEKPRNLQITLLRVKRHKNAQLSR